MQLACGVEVAAAGRIFTGRITHSADFQTDGGQCDLHRLECVTPGDPLFEPARRHVLHVTQGPIRCCACFYSLQHDAPARIDFYRARVVDGLDNVVRGRFLAVAVSEVGEVHAAAEGARVDNTVREQGMNEADLNKIIEKMVRRIVAAVQPRRIILFGSAARGQMGPNSDLDVLVVMPDGTHRRRTAGQICRALSRLGVPKDVVVVTESDVERFADDPSLVIHPALRDGRELYHAGT